MYGMSDENVRRQIIHMAINLPSTIFHLLNDPPEGTKIKKQMKLHHPSETIKP